MKKLIPVLLSLMLMLFFGCETKNYSPDVTSGFDLPAVVTTGDFTYSCRICRNTSGITVTVDSTNAKGLSMAYDGKNVKYVYSDMAFEAPGDNAQKLNPAVAVYDVFYYITATENLNVKKTDDGFRYEGSTAQGKFILYQNNDSTYSSIHFLSADLLIEFGEE